MAQPIKRVAVIGAGVSGVAAAAHLKAADLQVTLFERSNTAGGVWYELNHIFQELVY
jgi:cation diffusion facilitator CzcD-associated flavoprotein CzcO